MRRFALMFCALCCSACAVMAQAPPPAAPTPLETAVAFLTAYNAHDVAAVLALSDEDIAWLSVAGNRVEVVAQGREALGEALQSYFDEYPETRSEIDATLINGAYVATREIAFWRQDGREQVQLALAVYEICETRVCRVWYYPAVYR